MNVLVLLGLVCALCAEACGVWINPTAALVSFTLWSANVGVSQGFFGFFRRRTKAKSPSRIPQAVEEMSAGSNGPSGFPFQQGGMFNSFQQNSGFQQGMQQQPPRSPFQGHSFQGGSFQSQVAQQMAQQNIPQHVQDQVFKQMQDNPPVPDGMEGMDFNNAGDGSPGINAEEAESFFTLLAETDEGHCISRLVCEMGADPSNSGDFGSTIVDMISNLSDFPPGTKVAHYNEILQFGMQRGLSGCMTRFSSCDNESLQMVKSAQLGES